MFKNFFYGLLIFTAFSIQPLYADQLIVEPDMGRAPILHAIDSTQHTINLVMYGFTDKVLLDKLIKEKQHGRTVKIILEKSPYKASYENTATIQALQENGVSFQGCPSTFRLVHQKTLLVDDNQAIVMTFNFTNSVYKKMRNFGLILSDKKDIKEIAEHFSADWNNQLAINSSPHLIWSPDNSREKIINLIKKAQHSILIYAQSVQDYKIVGELAKAARSGVEVNILTSNKIKKKLATYLKRAGVQIRFDKRLYIHAKVMILDNRQAIIGSTNLTSASLDKNRELSVITEDSAVVKQLMDVFYGDWQDSL